MKNGPYILRIVPDDYPGKRYRGRYAYEHHIVYWQKHGLIPNAREVIHHKNHDTRDNRIENLELTTKSEHSRHHARPIEYTHKNCAFCGNQLRLEARYVRYKTKRGRKNFYCSRSHQMKHQHSRVPELVQGPNC